ncbi:hypothetical protein [Nostoc sp. PCC 7107]
MGSYQPHLLYCHHKYCCFCILDILTTSSL